MENVDFDAEEQERRKRDQIAYRTKKHFSTRFMLMASLFEIVETIILMFALFLVLAFVMFKLLHLEESAVGQNVFSAMLVVILIGGMILGFMIYKKVIRIVIVKFKLGTKLLDDILDHYFKEDEIRKLKEN